MIFKCSKTDLIKALGIVSKAISSKTTLPVLKGILISASGSSLKLAASDLDISIETKIEALVTEDGVTVVPSKLFMDIIRKLPEENMSMEEINDTIKLKSGKAEFELIGMDANEFPNITSSIEGAEKIEIEKELFGKMIKKTTFAASVDEAKGVLVGGLIEIEGNSINMVALDSFRMAVVRENTETSNGQKSIIIHARILNEIGKLIGENEDAEKIVINIEEKKAVVEIGNTTASIRIMDGEFIKYRDILRKETNTVMVVDRTEMLESLERASLFSNEGKNNLVSFQITEGLLTVSSKSEEGNIKEELFIDKEGKDINISFNSKYIIDILKAIEDEKVNFIFNSNVTPCIICPVNGDNYDYLALPVRIM